MRYLHRPLVTPSPHAAVQHQDGHEQLQMQASCSVVLCHWHGSPAHRAAQPGISPGISRCSSLLFPPCFIAISLCSTAWVIAWASKPDTFVVQFRYGFGAVPEPLTGVPSRSESCLTIAAQAPRRGRAAQCCSTSPARAATTSVHRGCTRFKYDQRCGMHGLGMGQCEPQQLLSQQSRHLTCEAAMVDTVADMQPLGVPGQLGCKASFILGQDPAVPPCP